MSNKIKKAYEDVINFLEANADKKVKSILPEVIEMCSAKAGGGGGSSTFHKNADGKVVAIQCYYHKKWMSPEAIEFGAKATSASGYNNMCREGVSKWTKQNNEAKKAREELLKAVGAGEVAADKVAGELEKIENARAVILPLEGDYQGFDTLEECLADNEKQGYAV